LAKEPSSQYVAEEKDQQENIPAEECIESKVYHINSIHND